MYENSRKLASAHLALVAKNWRVCFSTLFCVAVIGSAKADDLFRGSADASKLVGYEARNNTLLAQTLSGQPYSVFSLINTATNDQLVASIWLGYNNAQNIPPGIDNSGTFPEPSIGVMVGIGLLSLFGWQRLRRPLLAR